MYEVIVEEARKRGMAGATVLRGVLGFGAHSRIHTAKILRLSEDLPMVIEIVDTAERIEGFVPDLDKWIDEGMVTVEKVRVIHTGIARTSLENEANRRRQINRLVAVRVFAGVESRRDRWFHCRKYLSATEPARRRTGRSRMDSESRHHRPVADYYFFARLSRL
jgi:PII-like signaling protein